MKSIITILTILTNVSINAQTKGVTQTTPSPQSGEGRGEAYAVVGISDYQDPGIPDLRFSDKEWCKALIKNYFLDQLKN